MPTWSSMISSSSADITVLFNYVQPVFNWIFVAVIAIGVTTLAVGLLLRLVHGHGK